MSAILDRIADDVSPGNRADMTATMEEALTAGRPAAVQ